MKKIIKEFKDRFQKDQRAISVMNNKEVKKVTGENTIYLKKIIKDFGWPTISKFGAKNSKMAWVLLQHSSDIIFQQKCLELMKSLDKREVDQILIAYLEDRILVRQKKKQIYGTQFSKYGKMRPVVKSKSLDDRRLDIGLGPINEYVEMLREQRKRLRKK